MISVSVAGLVLFKEFKNLSRIAHWDMISEIYRRSIIKSI